MNQNELLTLLFF